MPYQNNCQRALILPSRESELMSIPDPYHIQALWPELTHGTRKPKILPLAPPLTDMLWYDLPISQTCTHTANTALQGAYKFMMQVRLIGLFIPTFSTSSEP